MQSAGLTSRPWKGDLYATQVFKCIDCQLLEYFLRAHVFARPLSWNCNPAPCCPRGCNCASQTGKVHSASIQSARQANPPGDSSRSMVHSAWGRWDNWPDIKILVSGTPPEIVHTRLSKADFAISRAHKSASEGRHVRRASLRMP